MESVRWKLRNIPDYQTALYDRGNDTYMILVDGDFVEIPKESFEKLFEQIDEKDYLAEEMYNNVSQREVFQNMPEEIKRMYKSYIKKNINDDGSFDSETFYYDIISESLKITGSNFIKKYCANMSQEEFIDFILSTLKKNYPEDYNKLINEMNMSEIRGTLADVYQKYAEKVLNDNNE